MEKIFEFEYLYFKRTKLVNLFKIVSTLGYISLGVSYIISYFIDACTVDTNLIFKAVYNYPKSIQQVLYQGTVIFYEQALCLSLSLQLKIT